MTDFVRKKCDKHLFMSFFNGKKRRILYFNDISDHVTLVQIMDTTGNVIYAVSITVFWMYD